MHLCLWWGLDPSQIIYASYIEKLREGAWGGDEAKIYSRSIWKDAQKARQA